MKRENSSTPRNIATKEADLRWELDERARELESLLRVSRAVTSTLDLNQLVRMILEQLREVVEYSAASLILLEASELVVYDLVEVTDAGIKGQPAGIRFRLPSSMNSWKATNPHHSSLDYPCVQVAASPDFWTLMRTEQSVIISDVFSAPEALACDYRENMGEHLNSPSLDSVRSWMAVPLTHKERILGYIGMASAEANYFDARHVRLSRAFAEQAAVAVENARLYERAQELAVLDERQRVARDLHDSVAQALYGVALGAKTAKKFLPADATAAVEPIDYVISLAAAGLAEMRALIFDLHPDSIRDEGVVRALDRQLAILPARHGIEVEWLAKDEPSVSIKTKEAIYAITREAIHNAVKHAHSPRVTVSVTTREGEVRFSVQDYGDGFDPQATPTGHLGLRSMSERMRRLGGTFTVESHAGKGTLVSCAMPIPETTVVNID